MSNLTRHRNKAAAFAAFAATLLFAQTAVAGHQDVEVSIPAGDAVLAGTLTLPDGKPKAAIVLVQGNGPHTRDQMISGARNMGLLAEALAEKGIATVRVDNSGVGQSTGERIQHFKQRIPQITAVVDHMAARSELQGIPLGILGHSEGSMIVTEVWAQRDEPIDFVVVMGAVGRDGRTVWVDQQANPARWTEHTPQQQAVIRAAFNSVVDASISGNRDAVEAAVRNLFKEAGSTEEEIAENLQGFTDRMASPEMQVFLAHDPMPVFAKVTDPVLAVWGDIDPLTSPEINVQPYLLNRNAASRLTVQVLPDEEHFFLYGDGLKPGEHKFNQMKLSPRLPETINGWLDNEIAAGKVN